MNSDYKQALIDNGVAKKGHFRLTSGRHSDIYISKDAIYCNPELFSATVGLLEAMSFVQQNYPELPASTLNQEEDIDIITGPAIAGAVLAAPIALRTGKIFVYLEKHRKPIVENGHLVEYRDVPQLLREYSKMVAGKKVLLIEDIITTGESVNDTMKCIHEAGGQVVEVRCIWNRSGLQRFIGTRKGDNGLEGDFVPILSIINEKVESWEPEECPICYELATSDITGEQTTAVLLTDPEVES